MENPSLAQVGWSEMWATVFKGLPETHLSLTCGRVIAQHRGRWTVAHGAGISSADLPGRFRKLSSIAKPAVGDWVRIAIRADGATIFDLFPRVSTLTRLVVGGTTDAQVIAANIDVVMIVVPLDVEPNVRRLERQLSTVWESGATPVIVATKADLCDNRGVAEATLREAALGILVLIVSSRTGEGLGAVESVAAAGVSLALLGVSGAGKSTLANQLIGADVMPTREVDSIGKGRHTTVHRQMLLLPTGALLIDTPGMRELGLWISDEEGVSATFADVEAVATTCRFANCGHSGDRGCAIPIAVAAGVLTADRVDGWRKLLDEQAWVEHRQDARLQAEAKKKFAALVRDAKDRARP